MSFVMMGARTELLAAEFRRVGMTSPAAATLSSEAVLRHPFVHRVGVKKLIGRMVRLGVQSEEATHLVLALWGLERLQLGACFQDLLETLRRAGVEEAQVFPACVEARRLHAACHAAAPSEEDADLQLARWSVALLFTLLAVGALVQLAG